LKILVVGLLSGLFLVPVHASLITSFYGDNDGFGVGVTSGTIDPTVSNQEVGDAPFTDTRLIADSLFAAGPFNPTGNFESFSVDGLITNAVLTLRLGSFRSVDTLNAPNRIFLDGLLVEPLFINGFSTIISDDIETRSIVLDSSFFSLLSDGLVSLAGTHLSESRGSGSFQVDFLSLEITTDTASVPEPSSVALIGLGLAGISFARKKKAE